MITENSEDVVIRCDAVWKLYGDAARGLARDGAGSITDEVLAKKDVIAAVRDVSLEVRRDEIFVIMGLSGSGKSTLLRCMTGLVELTMGELEVAGYEIGLEMGEDYVGDTQALSGRIVDVLIGVPSRVDDGRLTADLVADQVRGLGEAIKEVLLEEHAVPPLSTYLTIPA